MEGVKLGPMAKKEKVTCPECSSARIVKKGRQKNKFGQVQRYKCKSCGRSLSFKELTGIWLRNFVCGWFNEKNYFEFRPADVVLKLKEVDRSEMRKYTPQF